MIGKLVIDEWGSREAFQADEKRVVGRGSCVSGDILLEGRSGEDPVKVRSRSGRGYSEVRVSKPECRWMVLENAPL